MHKRYNPVKRHGKYKVYETVAAVTQQIVLQKTLLL